MEYNPKTYHIRTLGCQANIADSNTMAGILEALGFEEREADNLKDNDSEQLKALLEGLDLFIVNTCSVRQKSEDKVFGLGKIFKNIPPDKKPFVIMAGCMVGSVTGERQRYELNELKKKTPWADMYMNPSQLYELPGKLSEQGVLSDWAVNKLDRDTIVSKQTDPKHAFVNISYGCDNFCTFCVVPYARGQEVSRTEQEIVTEIMHYLKRGITEITLCGQNVNSWGLSPKEKFELRTGSDQKLPFANLLRIVHALPGVEKIDFLSSNPFDFTSDLIEVLKMPKMSNYLHIAIQSGSNEVLKKMNRRHTIEDFYKLVNLIKQAKPDAEFGTDIIVGFPGETEEQFMETVALFRKVKFNVAYISMYSPRKGTPAEKFYKDDVSLKEKKRRHAYLTKVWKESPIDKG